MNHLSVISHELNGSFIGQRPEDGYIDATSMCRAAGKEWSNYRQNANTDAFFAALEGSLGIPRDRLIQTILSGPNDQRGTWIHPQIAVNLATWLSPEFAVKVSQWVFEWISSGKITPTDAIPYHLRRYLANRANVPDGHFSILSEMTTLIIAPMEQAGYRLPEHMLPDISSGKMFCRWLREEMGIDTDSLPMYWHYFEDGRVVHAKAYPDELLHHFRKHLREEWIPNRAISYFRERDPNAIEYVAAIYPKQIGGKAA